MAHVPRGRREGCEDNEKDRSAEWEEGNESIKPRNQPAILPIDFKRATDKMLFYALGPSISLQISDGPLLEAKT